MHVIDLGREIVMTEQANDYQVAAVADEIDKVCQRALVTVDMEDVATGLIYALVKLIQQNIVKQHPDLSHAAQITLAALTFSEFREVLTSVMQPEDDPVVDR